MTTKEEKRQLLMGLEKIESQLSYIEDIAKGEIGNLITDVRSNILNVISFLSTLPDEGEKVCEHPKYERVIDQDGHEYCGRCFTTFN